MLTIKTIFKNLIKKSKNIDFYENEGIVSITFDNVEYKLRGDNLNAWQTFIEENLHYAKNLNSLSINTRYENEHDNKHTRFPKNITNLTLPNMLNLNMNELKNIEYLNFKEDFGIDIEIINTLPKSLKEFNIIVFRGYEYLYDELLKKCKELGIIFNVEEEYFEESED